MVIYIDIPEGTKCLLKAGQNVSFDTPFLQTREIKEVSVPLSQKLGVSPEKIFTFMKKFVGDSLKKGDVIAEKNSLFTVKKVRSEHEGILKEINHLDGHIVINDTEGEKTIMKSYFKGEAEKIDDKRITLRVSSAKDFKAKTPSSDFGGQYIILTGQPDIQGIDVDNKILIFDSISDYAATKAEALGARGFISLKSVGSVTIPTTLFTSIEDYKKVEKLEMTYCTVSSTYSTMYFYNTK